MSSIYEDDAEYAEIFRGTGSVFEDPMMRALARSSCATNVPGGLMHVLQAQSAFQGRRGGRLSGRGSSPEASAGPLLRRADIVEEQPLRLSDMKPAQQAELKRTDPELYAQLRNAPKFSEPKTYEQLRPAERATLKRNDAALYERMRAGEPGLTYQVPQ